MIYIYGDSHGEFSFKNLTYEHQKCHNYGTTMHRVGRDKYIPNFQYNHLSNDNIFLLSFGEVDCRAHIKKQINNGRNLDEICYTLSHKYFETIKNLIINSKAIVIVAIIPATCEEKYNEINKDYPFVGTNEERKLYRKTLNDYLKQFSNRYGYIYFDPYDPYEDDAEMLKYELSDTNVHIGNDILILEAFDNLYKNIQKRKKIFVDNLWSPVMGEYIHLFNSEYYEYTKNLQESDIILQSNWNNPIKNSGSKNIMLCMEPFTPQHTEHFDIVLLSNKNIKGENISYWTMGTFFMYFKGYQNYILNRQVPNFDSKKFCLFISSNHTPQRVRFCQELMKYKQVDCFGKVCKNQPDFTYMFWSSEFLELIKQYKFMICFENSNNEGYFSEKIINAYVGNTVPIYWCSKNNYQFFNKKCLVSLEDFTEDDISNAVKEIINLDTDDDLYNKKLQEPLFIDNKIPEFFEIDYIQKQINQKLL